MSLPTCFLALPASGEGTFAGLERKLRLLALRRLLTSPPLGLPPAQAAALPRLQALLAGVARIQPTALREALACPDVLAPLLVLEAGLGPPAPLIAAAVPPLLLKLARAHAVPEALIWPGPIPRLIDEDIGGEYILDDAAQALLVDPGGAELRLAGGALLRLVGPGAAPVPAVAFFDLAPGLRLSLVDSNPLRDVEDHPDKDGNSIDLGGRDAAEWVAALKHALELVALALPTWMAELPLSLRRIVPVGFQPERHLSASYREAPGLCYLSLHPDPLTMAEAIVHETQHGKLGVLLHLDPVLHNGRTTWTASPVRPDLRPLMGVLLAVHAFVPVAALHAELARLDHPLSRSAAFQARRRQVLAGNARGLGLVEDQGQPSAVGARLLTQLRRLHDALAAQVPDLVADGQALPPG